jgi:hypothetical protein
MKYYVSFSGLCGIYDGNEKNDIHDVDGNVFKNIDIKDYTQSWAKAWQ